MHNIVGLKLTKNDFGPVMNCHPFRISCLFLLLIVFGACGTTPQPSLGPEAMQGAVGAEPIADYHLRPGDEIEIKFFYHPELNERLMVGPDGKISLQLIDEVLAAGLTPSQLDELLTKEYDKHLENFSINVIVRQYSGLRVYVGGAVGRPGYVALTGNMTVLQSIFASGGFTTISKTENVILVRKGPDSAPVAMVVDLAPVMSGEQTENDIYLVASDIVYVPTTWIGKAGIFVDQYLRKVLMVDSVIQGIGWALGYNWVIEYD